MDSEETPRSYFQKWVDRKLSIAQRLLDGELEGSYYDGTLIVSALIGGLASIAWPRREGGDRRRFVEAWVRLAPASLGTDRISLPLLISGLETSRNADAARKLRETNRAFSPGYDSLVIAGDEVDLSADRVKEIVPELDAAEIRKFSYGSVFYNEVRSSLMHEYQLGANAEAHAMAEKADGPSYVNRLDHSIFKPDDVTERRPVHFPYSWLEKVARGIAEKVEPFLTFEPAERPSAPTVWWLHGG